MTTWEIVYLADILARVMKTLITGASGHLGTALVSYYIEKGYDSSGLVLLGNSEKRSDTLRRKFGTEVLTGDICNANFLRRIFDTNSISKIIHCAAIKYVSIANDNPTRAVEINILASYNLYNLAIEHGIRDVISISTDKAINPSNTYGMTKKLMEEMAIEYGFCVVSGVNFFGSTGSVLDVWYDQLSSSKDLSITNMDCVRYFVKTEEMVNLILDSFGKNKIIYCKYVYRVLMSDLLAAFKSVFVYDSHIVTGLLPGEKLEEELPYGIKIINSTKNDLIDMIKLWKKDRFE